MQEVNQSVYEKYIEQVKSAVERKTGKSVAVEKVSKNNGLVLDSLTILSEDENISPRIYLNDFFNEYLTNGVNAAAEKIIQIYEEYRVKRSIDTSFFTDIEKVKPNIKMKLVNYEKNKELLEKVPHERFLDLAITFTVALESDYGAASIPIYNDHLELWGIDAEDLYNIAMENTTYDYDIVPMQDIIGGFIDMEYVRDSKIKMSVLSNRPRMCGAAGMLHTEVLDNYLQKKRLEKILIFPSSIDEVILFSSNMQEDMEDIGWAKNMVKEINRTTLAADEVLSDNVYIYDGNKVTIAE